MYYYLLDERVSKKHPATLTKVKSWIKASQIAGEQIELHSPQHIIETAKKLSEKNPTPTIVAIGDDLSLDLTISGVQAAQQPVVVGFIPLQKGSGASKLLGLKDWQSACKHLIQRKTQAYPLLALNALCFLSVAELDFKTTTAAAHSSQQIRLSVDEKLELTSTVTTLRFLNSSEAEQKTQHDAPWLLEILLARQEHLKLQNKQPFFASDKNILSSKKEVITRLSVRSVTIETLLKLFLHNVIPFSGHILIQKHPKAQPLITARSEQSISG